MVEHAQAEAEARSATVLADPAFGRPTRHDEVGRVVRVEVPADPRVAEWWLSHRRSQDCHVLWHQKGSTRALGTIGPHE